MRTVGAAHIRKTLDHFVKKNAEPLSARRCETTFLVVVLSQATFFERSFVWLDLVLCVAKQSCIVSCTLTSWIRVTRVEAVQSPI